MVYIQEKVTTDTKTGCIVRNPALSRWGDSKVSDYFVYNSRDYLVMDFVPGRDLKQIMEEAHSSGNRLAEEQILDWARQILDALEYLHAQDPPVLHRDIKPANIRLTPLGRIKLVDFGLVKLLIPDQDATATVLQGRGTAQYTPLEQYGGDTGHTGIRSDIYALGATLYHLLTGRPPVDAKSRYLRPGSLLSPAQVNPDLSSHVEQAILHALALHPDERPVSVAVFRGELYAPQAHKAARDWFILSRVRRYWEALRENLWLLLVIIILLVAALVSTLLSPYLS